MGQRVRLRCVNDDHQGIPHGPILTEKIWSSARSEELFLVPLVCWGSPPLLFLFTPLFIVVFLLLTRVSRVGTCPISPYLQLLGVVVRTEKYGYVRHRALNAIKAASLRRFCSLYYLSLL